MTKRKLKPFVVPMIYSLAAILLISSVYLIKQAVSNSIFDNNQNDTEYVDNDIIKSKEEDYLPVVAPETTIIRPYLNTSITIGKSYYDYLAEQESQQKSIIYFEDTYMQNSGVDYVLEETFDVISILEGTVITVDENELLGKYVEVRHNNDIISVYQSLSEVTVSLNDNITQGQVIGKSGKSNILSDLGNHLHFELYYQGKIVNPEDYYSKSINEL